MIDQQSVLDSANLLATFTVELMEDAIAQGAMAFMKSIAECHGRASMLNMLGKDIQTLASAVEVLARNAETAEQDQSA